MLDTQISCGGNHTLAVTQDGCLFSWGRASFGQTGLNRLENTTLPRPVMANGLEDHGIMQVKLFLESCSAQHTKSIESKFALSYLESKSKLAPHCNGTSIIEAARQTVLMHHLISTDATPLPWL